MSKKFGAGVFALLLLFCLYTSGVSASTGNRWSTGGAAAASGGRVVRPSGFGLDSVSVSECFLELLHGTLEKAVLLEDTLDW
jgi:hypothetical protein